MGDLDRLGDLLPPEASGWGATSRTRSVTGSAAPNVGSDDELGRRVAEVWAEEMGPEIAANARPVQLRAGRLVVTTSSSAWAQTLQLMSPMVVERLNRRVGGGSVEKAVFRHAGWDSAWSVVGAAEQPAAGSKPASPSEGAVKPAASATGEPADLSSDEQRALAEVDGLPLPPSVRRTIRQAMIADFARAKQDSGRS